MLGEMYGASFMAKYGDAPGPLWRTEIAKLDDAQLEAGIARLMDAGGAFPPSLPEFRAACVQQEDCEASNEAVELLAYEMIPSFERSTLSRKDLEFLAKRNLDRARALLNGEASPRDSEGNTMERLGFKSSKALAIQ